MCENQTENQAENLNTIPGDLNTVFFTTDGSTANDTALRFIMFYNNMLGRPNKKHILTRNKAYHGSTYLTGSITGKEYC